MPVLRATRNLPRWPRGEARDIPEEAMSRRLQTQLARGWLELVESEPAEPDTEPEPDEEPEPEAEVDPDEESEEPE
jgi:hypothetical protein